MRLKIHKNYLDKVEQYTKFGAGGSYNPYAVRYVFNMPQGEYENYALMIDSDDYRFSDRKLVVESVGSNRERKGDYYYLEVEEGKKFTLTRYKNREEGKRYKRYELNGSELSAIFNYNKSIEKLPLVIAEVKQYLNNGTRNAGSVISSKITIGHSDGRWLYIDDERRKINSKGVNIIGELPLKHKDEADSIISTFYLEKDTILRESSLIVSNAGALDSIYRSAQNLDIKDASEKICKICLDKRSELKTKLDSNQERLSSIERICLDKLAALCSSVEIVEETDASYLVGIGENDYEKLEIPKADVEKLKDGSIKATIYSEKDYVISGGNKKEIIKGTAAKELLNASPNSSQCELSNSSNKKVRL